MNDHVVASLAVAARPVATVLRREIYFSFFMMTVENPNLYPRGKLSWEVFASAYTADIAPHILLTCSHVGFPNIRCNNFAYIFCTDVSRANVMVK